MLLLAVALLACFLLLWLAGVFLLGALGLQNKNPFLAFWAGIFPIGLTGLLLSLFVPLQGAAAALCFWASGLGLWRLWRKGGQQTGLSVLGSALTLVLIALLAYKTGYAEFKDGGGGDTPGYHLNLVRYLQDYGTVAGIGNLQFRLGMNSTWHVLAALFEQGPLLGRSAYLMQGLLGLGALGWCVAEVATSAAIWRRLYAAGLIPLVAYYLRDMRPSLYYDNAALFLCAVVFSICLRILLQKDNRTVMAHCVLVLTATAFMLKPLNPLFVAGCAGVAVWGVWHDSPLGRLRRLALVCVLPGFAAGVWIAKNVLLTGYPVYPSTIFPFPVDWRMAEAKTRECLECILGWARMPNELYHESLRQGLGFWFPSWLERQIQSFEMWYNGFVPLGLGCVVWLLACVRQRGAVVWCVLGLTLASLAGWFCSAPEIRFGSAYFWIFLAAGAACLFRNQTASGLTPRVRVVLWALGATLLGLLVFFYQRGSHHSERDWLAPAPAMLGNAVPARIQPDDGAEPFDVFVPRGEGKGCANGPVPCTSEPNGGFCLRDPRQWANGFRDCRSHFAGYVSP